MTPGSHPRSQSCLDECGGATPRPATGFARGSDYLDLSNSSGDHSRTWMDLKLDLLDFWSSFKVHLKFMKFSDHISMKVEAIHAVRVLGNLWRSHSPKFQWLSWHGRKVPQLQKNGLFNPFQLRKLGAKLKRCHVIEAFEAWHSTDIVVIHHWGQARGLQPVQTNLLQIEISTPAP